MKSSSTSKCLWRAVNKRVDALRNGGLQNLIAMMGGTPVANPTSPRVPARPIRLDSPEHEFCTKIPQGGVFHERKTNVAARPSWRGVLRLSLISIPVRAYSSLTNVDSFGLHQLHDKCHRRINYKRFCPIHGEVAYSDIVKGYEYEKDKYVVFEPEELAAIHSESSDAIAIDTFVDVKTIDPIYLEKPFYLVPDGKSGHEAFTVFRQALSERHRVALAEMVLSDREQTVCIRPLGKILAMSTLRYQAEVKEIASFEEEVDEITIRRDEVKLMETLIDSKTSRKFVFSKYEDQYAKRMTELIEAKVQGKEIITQPKHEQPGIINLMSALKASLRTKEKGSPAASKRTRVRKIPRQTVRKKSG